VGTISASRHRILDLWLGVAVAGTIFRSPQLSQGRRSLTQPLLQHAGKNAILSGRQRGQPAMLLESGWKQQQHTVAPSLSNTIDSDLQNLQKTFSEFTRGEYAYDSENMRGVTLALLSSLFIGVSFIIKKKGLLAAGQTGLRAREGGYAYLLQPLWWVGMATMVGGEFANLAAYAYAPAIVVTPLGASTIIVSTILARCFLGESMHVCGVFACVLTVFGSVVLVLHAPNEAPLTSVEQIWKLATQPQFLVYVAAILVLSLVLMYRFAPRCALPPSLSRIHQALFCAVAHCVSMTAPPAR
jgi:hypothetical protein